MTTTYTYTTKKGNLKETFDTKGYVTLEKEDGTFIYEHQFSTIGVKLQEIELQKVLLKNNIEFTKTENN
jgi:hypothetical protein